MKLIIINDPHHRSKTFSPGRWFGSLMLLGLLALPLAGVYLGYQVATVDDNVQGQQTLQWLKAQTYSDHQAMQEIEQNTLQQLQALTVRIAELQARLVRLDALGERLAVAAELDVSEFNFDQPPALGGPEIAAVTQADTGYSPPDFVDAIDDLLRHINEREQQLGILESLLANRKLQDDVFLAGRPIKKGWMSSAFGYRADPFSGRRAMHQGIDFAGDDGDDIIAVAAGVVTWSGERRGYGNLVEIDHGEGYRTRYAHSKENLVVAGDIVKKGQVIALMGSTGRSTGPHVHFEVHKDGKVVNPGGLYPARWAGVIIQITEVR